MSICRGVAGRRGVNPIGIFIHNDAGSKNANSEFYRKWLQAHNLGNGFAHYYVAQDGTLQAEDDINHACIVEILTETTIICQLKSARVWVILKYSKRTKISVTVSSTEVQTVRHRTKPEHNSIASRSVCNIMSAQICRDSWWSFWM